MDRAPTKDISANARAHERCVERARALAAVRFMGLSIPEQVEPPPPSFFSRVRSLLFRA